MRTTLDRGTTRRRIPTLVLAAVGIAVVLLAGCMPARPPSTKPVAEPDTQIIQGFWSSYTVGDDQRQLTLTLNCTYQGNERPDHAEVTMQSDEYVVVQVFVEVPVSSGTPCRPGPIGQLTVTLDQSLGDRGVLQASRPLPPPPELNQPDELTAEDLESLDDLRETVGPDQPEAQPAQPVEGLPSFTG